MDTVLGRMPSAATVLFLLLALLVPPTAFGGPPEAEKIDDLVDRSGDPDVLRSSNYAQDEGLPGSATNPAPPPGLPPSELAPAGGGRILPAIADAYVSEQFVPEEQPVSKGDQATDSLTIGHRWHGGDAGLDVLKELPPIKLLTLDRAPLTDAALKRIAALESLAELHIHGTSFSTAALRGLRQRRPELRLFIRGETTFGVSAEVSGPCRLTAVKRGSDAEEAGLLAGDCIIAADGRPVYDQSDLAIAVYGHNVPEPMPVQFVRGDQKFETSVVLKRRPIVASETR